MKKICCLATLICLTGCQVKSNLTVDFSSSDTSETTLTPTAVVAQSSATEWRSLDHDNTLYMNTETGLVVIELLPEIAPLHVENTKALVRAGVFDGTNFYRVIDGFVAQGGPLYESEADLVPLENGTYTVAAEFTMKGQLDSEFTPFDDADGYADETGFVKSFAIGKDTDSNESWLLHCYGAFAMGRANDINTGGTALYIVNGPAQRYLDRNTTVFGRVVEGMAHIQSLMRGSDLSGPVDLRGRNIIEDVHVAADLPPEDLLPIEVMKSDSESFRLLLQARKNRSGEWFVHQHDYMDACGVPIPVRLQSTTD